MRHYTRVTLGTALIGAILVGMICFTGCNESAETPGPEGSGESSATKSTDGVSTPVTNGTKSSDATPIPVKPTMPTVKLTEALAKTCLVNVGDMMPEVTLAKLDGQAATLRSLAGEKLTVVCFWKADHPRSTEELRQLQKYIAELYATKGVQIIAINEDDPTNLAGNAFRETGATYPCLLDPRGDYFAKVATQDLPRTYLLDAEGKVLWFDIEYSRSTQRDLEQGIQFMLEPDGQ